MNDRGGCGQAHSDLEFTRFLVDAGIDSFSITPDSFAAVLKNVAPEEKKKPYAFQRVKVFFSQITEGNIKEGIMFGKRFHLLTVNQISIGFDVSWFFIAILLTWTLAGGYFPHYYPGLEGYSYFFMGLLGMLGLFLSVVLHELGHALTAKRFGLPISRITLFIFGGIAELREDPPSPKAEFLVAIAGPIVTVILAGCFEGLAVMARNVGFATPAVAIFSYLAVINLIIVIFNLIPAFPLDGGRMFRAMLWWAKGRLGWATNVASRIGLGFGFMLIFLGLFVIIAGNFIAGLWWMILGLFLQQTASMSRTQYYVKKKLRGEKVKNFMVKDLATVLPGVSIREFIEEHVYKTYHYLYPVVDGEELLGYISLKEVKDLGREQWERTKVKDVLVPVDQIDTLSPEKDILEALSLLNKSSADSLLVTEEGKLVGLLSSGDLSKVISFKLKLEDQSF
ncbi:MAG: site-2 protease family protein [Waddliaceae bacterium]